MDKKGKLLIMIVVIVIVFISAWLFISLNVNKAGIIRVDSFPKGADVYVDGVKKGETPIEIKGLKLGMYEVEIRKDGYKTEIYQKKIDRNNLKQLIFANLIHKTFTLQITSYPTEAEVYVDGVKKGLTPITIDDLLYGKHFVEVKKENFSTWSKEIDVEEYKVIQLDAELNAKFASIDITTDPAGATVYLNNEKKGITPIEIKNLDSGKYKLSIQRDGYAPYEETIETVKGNTIEREIKLKKASTILMIDSKPTGADLYINGVLKGKTPYTKINIAPGKYGIDIKKEGYLPFSTTVQVELNKKSNFVFPLLKLPQSKP